VTRRIPTGRDYEHPPRGLLTQVWRDGGYAPWPSRMPPKFEVERAGERRFRVKGLA
jgi:hypothetical protein